MLARVRWTNLAAALAVAGILVAVVAWPRLAPDPPALPPAPTPLAEVTVVATPTASFERSVPWVKRKPRRAVAKKRVRRHERPHRQVRRASGASAVVAAPAVVAPVVAPAVVVAPAPAPSRREFGGFER